MSRLRYGVCGVVLGVLAGLAKLDMVRNGGRRSSKGGWLLFTFCAMAAAGTVAVLLPGAFYFLRETQLPPMQALRKHGVKIAIASDLNPGTSPALSLRLMMNMACTLFRMTPEEALAGVTLHAATALGMGETHGSLEPGKVADFVAWNIDRPADLAYWLGGDLDKRVVRNGADVVL